MQDCRKLKIVGTASSTGGGGSLTYRWLVDGLSTWTVAGKDVHAGEKPTLDSVNTVQDLPLLGRDGVVGLHTIKLMVRNTISGLTSEQTVSFRVIKENKPTMSIVGGSVQSFVIGRPKSVQLDVQLLDLGLCPGASKDALDKQASTSRLDFVWMLNEQRLDTVSSDAPWGRVVELGRKFVMNTTMMPYCKDSILSVTVVQSNAVVTFNGTVAVILKPQIDDLVAVIQSSRSTAGSDNVVSLSATPSYDLSGLQTQRDMKFEWNCIAMTSIDSAVTEPGCRTVDGAEVRLNHITAAKFEFTPKQLSLQHGFSYTFAVNVSTPPPLPCYIDRSAVASASLNVVAGSKVPALTVSVCATCACNCAEPPPRYFNPGQSVCLTTECSRTKDSITSHKWNIVGTHSNPKSGLHESVIRVILGPPAPVNTGFEYKFGVSVGYQSGRRMTGTVSVLPNYPPVGGAISVSPGHGVAMTDDFLVSAVDWRDDNIPLRFEFSAEDRVVQRTSILYIGSESVLNGPLPFFEHPGKSKLAQHTLVITGMVHDSLGSSTKACSTKLTAACPNVVIKRKRHVAPHAEAEDLTNLLDRQLLTPLQATMRALSAAEGLDYAATGGSKGKSSSKDTKVKDPLVEARMQEKSRLKVCQCCKLG